MNGAKGNEISSVDLSTITCHLLAGDDSHDPKGSDFHNSRSVKKEHRGKEKR